MSWVGLGQMQFLRKYGEEEEKRQKKKKKIIWAVEMKELMEW